MTDQCSVLAAQVVSAYLSHNTVSLELLPSLIRDVRAAFMSVDEVPQVMPAPAVSAKKSIFPDYIVCLEDGKKLKTLKRHLMTSYSLTPEQYRVKWGLPNDYPMVAPSYAEQRSALAKNIGFGKKRETEIISEPEVEIPVVLETPKQTRLRAPSKTNRR